jgi:hypothetical protein
MAGENAFKRSGRFSVNHTTPSSVASSRSVTSIPLVIAIKVIAMSALRSSSSEEGMRQHCDLAVSITQCRLPASRAA